MHIILSSASGLVFVFVIGFYLRQVARSKTVPNAGGWLVTTSSIVLSTGTYVELAKEESAWIAVPQIVVAIGVPIVFFYSWYKGFAELARKDYLIIGASVVVGIYWKVSDDPYNSNLALQALLLMGHWMVIRGLNDRRGKEDLRPWIIAIGAYLLQIASVAASWGDESAILLVNPIMNGVVGNGSVITTGLLLKKRQ